MVKKIFRISKAFLRSLTFENLLYFLIHNVCTLYLFNFLGLLFWVVDRMPPQIGQIVSEAVYDSQLKSNPLHPITEEILACHFIDVPGTEKKGSSGSIMVCIVSVK